MVQRTPEGKVREMKRLKSGGFSYREIAEKTGTTLRTVKNYCCPGGPWERKEPEGNYREKLAKTAGYESFYDYAKTLAERRMRRQENRRVSALIRDGLKKVGDNINSPRFKTGYSWLSQQIGVSKEAVRQYASGMSIPPPEILKRIFEILGVSYKIIRTEEGAERVYEKERLEDKTITIKDLSLAIKSSKPGMEDEGAEQIAEVVMNQFGFTDVILDNSLESDVRDVFYNLEDEGLIGSESEEISLYSGKAWRIKYWALKKEKILKLVKTHNNATSSANEDFSGIYEEVPNEDWIGGLRAIDKEGGEESAA